MKENDQNLFFGLEVSAPWPEEVPIGRIISPQSRHLTLAFLGKVPPEKILSEVEAFPKPNLSLSSAGMCDKLLFLPQRHPRVVAYHINWMSGQEALHSFRETLVQWLRSLHYKIEERPFLSHVTLARAPFDEKGWRKHFSVLPIVIKTIHLYQSKGNLTYVPIWTFPMHLPFEEISHTGEVAYHIRGKDLRELFCHAQLAISFECPDFLRYYTPDLEWGSLEELIIALNEQVSKFDQEIGSPIKAISFHGELNRETPEIYHWEMIIDV